VLSLFSCPHTPHTLRPSPRTPLGHRPPHAPGVVARKPFSARFWSVPARETHTTPPHKHWPRHPRIVQCPFLPDPATKDAQRPWRNILTGEDEHILPPADDVNVHTPTIPPRQVCRAHHTPDGGGGRGGGTAIPHGLPGSASTLLAVRHRFPREWEISLPEPIRRSGDPDRRRTPNPSGLACIAHP